MTHLETSVFLKVKRVGVVALLCAASAALANPQKWPFEFDVSKAKDPTAVQNAINGGNATLPVLPLGELELLTTDDGAMKLWLWPQSVALLKGITASLVDGGTGAMVWPSMPLLCARHAAFSLPAFEADAGASCDAAKTQLAGLVTDLSACSLVEEPERYVTSYQPSKVRDELGNLEDLVGVAGEALTHMGLPAQGVLPTDFVPTLRRILLKVRQDTLSQQLTQTRGRLAQASQVVMQHSECFDAALAGELLALDGEVVSAAALVAQVSSQGQAAAAHENVCLAAKGRVRATLPFPSVTEDERRFAAYWLGGLYWRMRGGGLIPLGKTQDARKYFAGDAFARIGELVGGADGADLSQQFPCMLAGYGWSQWQDMGTNGTDKYADVVGFSDRGRRQVMGDLLCIFQQSATQLLTSRGYDSTPVIAGALQFGPGYYYAYYPNAAFRWGESVGAPYSGFIDWATASGEFTAGAGIGLGLAKALLAGKPSGKAPVSACGLRQCGSDGCGGECGTCAGSTPCSAEGLCISSGFDAGGPVDAGVNSPDAGGAVHDAGAEMAADAGREVMLADAGLDPEPSPGAGCGCSSGPLSMGGLVLGSWLLRRRRRPVQGAASA